jgi:hypothetical protein
MRPDGIPLWAGPAEPGSVHHITAARLHALPALYGAAALGMPSFAGGGYEGAGIGVLTRSKARRKPGTRPRHAHQERAAARPALPGGPGRTRPSSERQVQWQGRDQVTRSLMCSSGIHCRNQASTCPVPSRIQAACTLLILFSTLPAHPMCWRFTPAVHSPFFSCPVSSSARILCRPFRRPCLRAAASSPSAPNLRTTPIAADASHDAWLSSPCVLSGVLSPANFAILQPFAREDRSSPQPGTS